MRRWEICLTLVYICQDILRREDGDTLSSTRDKLLVLLSFFNQASMGHFKEWVYRLKDKVRNISEDYLPELREEFDRLRETVLKGCK